MAAKHHFPILIIAEGRDGFMCTECDWKYLPAANAGTARDPVGIYWDYCR